MVDAQIDLNSHQVDAFDVRQFRRAKSQKVGVPGWAMWYIEPQVKQQGSLERKLIRVAGNADPVQQTLNRVTGEYEVEILPGLTGPIEQATVLSGRIQISRRIRLGSIRAGICRHGKWCLYVV